MKDVADYTVERRKELGAFYSPKILSDFLAKTLLSFYKANPGETINVVDPATGDSILLSSMSSEALRSGLCVNIIGIDIDIHAIERSQKIFNQINVHDSFICTDALYPFGKKDSSSGWNILKEKYFPTGIDIIVSNPPWGADLSCYTSLGLHYKTASGQFDSYDLFIETIVNNLKEGGGYAIIVPDSIYCQEHYNTRKLLLDNTTICEIVRLGEGFFPDVNFAASLIFGIKNISNGNLVKCVHLTNKERKAILRGDITLESVCKETEIAVDSTLMTSCGYSFITDVSALDLPIMSNLNQLDRFGNYINSHRGVELSKRGNVLECPNCGKWFPEPRNGEKGIVCPHCKSIFIKEIVLTKDHIISNSSTSNSNLLIVGEDISRYKTVPNKYIKLGYDGIKYKDSSLYEGVKVLIRKTGVGITAGIDYNNCHVNQVVYIIRPKDEINKAITCEVLLALLNSRIMTYYIIKKFGSTGWKSNPYLSQDNVLSLPFPKLNINDVGTIYSLEKITNLVRYLTSLEEVDSKADIEIECLVAKLYGISINYYKVIMGAIRSVESLIPFKRLLNIKEEDLISNGL